MTRSRQLRRALPYLLIGLIVLAGIDHYTGREHIVEASVISTHESTQRENTDFTERLRVRLADGQRVDIEVGMARRFQPGQSIRVRITRGGLFGMRGYSLLQD